MAVVEQFKKKIAGTDLVGNFFAELEALQFPEALVRETLPGSSHALEASWRDPKHPLGLGYVCRAVPDKLFGTHRGPPAPSSPLTYTRCFGSSSYILGLLLPPTLLRLYGDALDIIEARGRADRRERRANWKLTHGGKAAGRGAGKGGPGKA